MGILRRIRSSLSPGTRLLEQLARIGGQVETLAARLRAHAETCSYPTIKLGLERLAMSQAAQAKILRELLLDRGAWPALPQTPVHEGSNNWERLNGDLTLQVRLFRDLNLQIAEWEVVDPQLAVRLREFAAEEDKTLADLRDLALKCDPQALD
jgi:hypothetical protein